MLKKLNNVALFATLAIASSLAMTLGFTKLGFLFLGFALFFLWQMNK